MACSSKVRTRYGTLPAVAAFAILFLSFAGGAGAQVSPTLTTITPSGRTDLTSDTVDVTLAGTGFADGMALGFDPSGVIDPTTVASTLKQTGGVSATVTFKLKNSATAIQVVKVWVQTANGPSASLPFNTGTVSSTCLEALTTGQCALLWEVDATSATGSSSQSNNNTAPNIMVKLDFQWHAPKNRQQKRFLAQQLEAPQLPANPFLAGLLIKAKTDPQKTEEALLKNSWTDHLAGHVVFKTGYTQVVTTTNVQPSYGNTCPGGTSTSNAMCTSAIPQQAFVAELGTRLGWTTAVEGQGIFGEFGFGARGSFQYLIPSNKVVQNGGLTYIDLSSANPHNAVGFYEATGHFRLAQLGHNKTLINANTQNASNLLVFEGGYQNNRGLQQLMASDPQLDTRNRYVARFYVNPEISSTNHTQLTLGMEYSGGINGGPHVIQLFFGTNLNPAKLFKGGN
jgi:hypothetical protein